MTQEELLTKAETLYNIGEYSQIISLIQSLPEEQQTYNLLYLLALSYSYNLEGNDDDNQHHALKILKKIADQGECDLKWLYLIGKIYFTINKEEYAIKLQIEINHLHRSGATLFFKIMYPDNYYQTYHIDGDANTYENGIADAINKFVCIINKDFMEHCK